jgi:hypothetical protein
MSIEALTWAWKQPVKCSRDRLVLLALADHANDDGECYPNQDQIAAKAMCSVDSVQRSTKRLIAAGLVAIKRRGGTGNGRWANLYKLAVAVIVKLPADNPEVQENLREQATPQNAALQGGNTANDGGLNRKAVRHQPSLIQPSLKETPVAPKGAPTPGDALKAFAAYNQTALRCALQQAGRLTPDRQRKIIARLREYSLDGWMQALANLERSAFLRGKNDRNWRANLDFLLQASSFSKVHDGQYGNGATPKLLQPAPARRRVPDIRDPEWNAYCEQMMREMGVQPNG